MPVVADGAARIGADMKPFDKDLKAGLNKGGKQVETFGQRINNALNPKNLAGGLAAGFFGSQVIAAIGDATNAAAEFQDSVSATGVIFGEDLTPEVERWAESAHSAFGASKQGAIEAANQFAVFGKSAGLVGDELVGFSTEMVQLGGDLASFFGGTTQEAITAVGAALRGESEPIRRYGVLLDDATLRQQAFEMGLISTTKNALTPQQRVLAAHAEILEQTQDAQGDFVRTSDGMANQQRALAAQLENVNIELGEKLLPVMLDLVTFVKDTGIPIMREFIDLLDFSNENSADDIPILGQIEDVLNFIPQQGLLLGDQLRGMQTDIERAAAEIGMTYMELRPLVIDQMNRLGIDHEAAIERILEQERRITEATENPYSDYGLRIAEGASQIRTATDGVAGALTDPIEEGADTAVEEVRSMYARMASVIAAREEELRQAGGNAVEAWFNPELLRNQVTIIQGELEQANADLLTAQQEGTAAEVAEAENRVLQLTAEAMELQQNLALIGTDMEQAAALSALMTSDFMQEGLHSEDEEIKRAFEAWYAELERNADLMESKADTTGVNVPDLLETGIHAGMPDVKTAADALANAVQSPFNQLKPYPWGLAYGSDIAAGMWDSMHLISDAAYALANEMSLSHKIESEPPDHNSPLYGHMKWGGKYVKDIADGMFGALDTAKAASAALAGSMVPALNTSMSPMAVGGAMGEGGGPTFILQVEGTPPFVGSKDDVLERWSQMIGFSDRSIR